MKTFRTAHLAAESITGETALDNQTAALSSIIEDRADRAGRFVQMVDGALVVVQSFTLYNYGRTGRPVNIQRLSKQGSQGLSVLCYRTK